ncbi:MAG: PspC domain-containing protein [Sphingobacteriia bacterium]|nr:PspC domain-containing protein [Sphingobacteriia bacterium]
MSQLHKSNKNRVFLGVCGGLAESLGMDISLVRIGFVLGSIFTGSGLLWVYLLLALVLPTQE